MANVHCKQLMELENLKLVCAADICLEKAEDFKTKYGFESCTNDYKEALKSEKIDVVLIATTWQPRYKIITGTCQKVFPRKI